MSRGSPASSSNSASSISIPSSDESRSRARPGKARRIALDERAEATVHRAGRRPSEVRSTPVSTTSRAPASRCALDLAQDDWQPVPSGSAPRPCGIMQKVQAWSQPVCTGTNARVCPELRAATGA